jgi:signal transduction histidine kinase
MPPGRALTPTEERLLDDLAAQAGLVLNNARLMEELKASRQRIVSAHDEERRRIERDLHDGVQQRLLTLSLQLKMTAAQLERIPPQTLVDAIDHAANEARETMTELRRVARGIHPAVVTEGGLLAAVESVAERAAVPVTITASELGVLSVPVEVTIYYVVAETVTNAVKHSGASTVTIDLHRVDDRLIAEVVDDGVGGAVPSVGSGLSGLVDRVAAIGGTIEITSPLAAGTRVHAEIPCGSS